ncbi:UDP-glycosyltransferase 90A1-like [Senna tora]|uniref:Glycosyltransferase n=1 Tax=Senna tora TaxID=362788 RepID=A0A834TEN0_9FABA|nr:UDP-glycosyltransferase 90A1-like [Senna tora]
MGSSPCDDASLPPQPHVLLFPFMSKGHTIPLLYLARLLLRRGVAVTVITTPSNRPFIAQSLQPSSGAAIIDLPFPETLPGIPAGGSGVESVDNLPSISLFFNFAMATQLLQPHFERLLHSLLPRVTFLVSDGFLWWTLDSASKFGIPRFVFFGMSNYIHVVLEEVFNNNDGPQTHNDELVSLTPFPWIRLCKDDLECLVLRSHTKTSTEFRKKVGSATANSYGMIVNSFYELEPLFIDYWNTEYSAPRTWCIGPLCLDQKVQYSKPKQASWTQWLDQKLEDKCCVLYVAFGSQAEVSAEQVREIASGLEESKVNFLWVVRKKSEWEVVEGIEERVKERGMIVREWVDQREILMHESVEGFLSHCGWNSVLESVCAGVPILGFPLMAEQPLNARMVEEELKVGLRVEVEGGLVRKEELEKKVRELMEGEKGKEARKKVKELAAMAEKAVEEGGSSWCTLETLIHETC